MPGHLLSCRWELCSTPPGAIAAPGDLADAALEWLPAEAPSTVASTLRATGRWSLDAPPRRFDAEDWWYRARFDAPAVPHGGKLILGFDGLATLVDVWLNGKHLLRSDNMFIAHECDVSHATQTNNELVMHFHSLDAALTAKRPRPRWRAPMVEHQQLRWYRTTLLGRTPGWSPPAAAVGPWRDIWLDVRPSLRIDDVQLDAHLDGTTGQLKATGSIAAAELPAGADLCLLLQRNGVSYSTDLKLQGGRFAGELAVANADAWWPHTHGEPALYHARLQLRHQGRVIEERALGSIGFRSLTLNSGAGEFALQVNGVEVFCRGACWTPLDVVSLRATNDEYDRALEQVRDCGMNMLRLCGPMVYESEYFHRRCDELGILVWQDFMFANMDYPADDINFLQAARVEVSQALRRLTMHPSLAILCGNSEVEQQAAMWGTPRSHWSPALFHEVLADLARTYCPDVPYWPSSAHGGAFPHDSSAGSSSYYGVGAYLRPVEDARRSELTFASECLGFANVPEPITLARMPGGMATRVHHPAWKSRSPRDLGAGWDFDDVRDHYLADLFKVDPLKLRYADHERYLALSRLVPAELMSASFGEWRRRRSPCGGALIWFLRDLWPGAGWGVVASDGEPKAAYFYLRRALQPLSVHVSDEGCNGLVIHTGNESAQAISATLELAIYAQGEHQSVRVQTPLNLAARQHVEVPAAQLLDGFHDLSYAYRFGPPPQDLVVATLSAAGATTAAAHFLPLGLEAVQRGDIGLLATAQVAAHGGYTLRLSTRAFARSVFVDVEHFRCEDQYFHLTPGAERLLQLTPRDPQRVRSMRGTVQGINSSRPTTIEMRT